MEGKTKENKLFQLGPYENGPFQIAFMLRLTIMMKVLNHLPVKFIGSLKNIRKETRNQNLNEALVNSIDDYADEMVTYTQKSEVLKHVKTRT